MSHTEPTAQTRRMLLVEDDERILVVLTLLLAPFFEVQEAIDGASAEYWFGKQHFDVAFVDYTLPDMTGLDLLRRMRAANPLARRVLTSGRLMPELFPLTRDGLLHGFVHKPAPLEEIVWACGRAAARSRSLTL
jgi:two-component system OmpR family response regulator